MSTLRGAAVGKHWSILIFLILFWIVPTVGANPRALMQADFIHVPPGVELVVSPEAPEAVHRAAEDLRRDLATVLGSSSPLRASLDEVQGDVALVVLQPGSGEMHRADINSREAHGVFATRDRAGRSIIAMQGADLRGTLYAIYSLSEHYLGVPRLQVWSSWRPNPDCKVRVPRYRPLLF